MSLARRSIATPSCGVKPSETTSMCLVIRRSHRNATADRQITFAKLRLFDHIQKANPSRPVTH